jgi:hypothetical protein
MEAEDKKLHMANRCILAQDQALYWGDSEIDFLRWKWDRTLQLAQELELEKLDWRIDWSSLTRGTTSWCSSN